MAFSPPSPGEPTLLQAGTFHIMKMAEQVNDCSGKQSGRFPVCESALHQVGCPSGLANTAPELQFTEEDIRCHGGISGLQVKQT